MRIFLIILNLTFAPLFCQEKIVAIVGNKIITEKDIIRKSKIEKINYQNSLNSLIEEKLLLYQAEKENIEVKDEEIKSEIERIKRNFSDPGDFYKYLKNINLTFSQFEEEIKDNLKIKKLLKDKIINKIQISPVEIAEEMRKIGKTFNEYEFYFKWFDNKEDCEKFIENFNQEKFNEMELTKVKSSEIIEEILSELENLDIGKLTKPIKVNTKWVVIYLKSKNRVDVERYEIYKQAKERIFKTKYLLLYQNYIEELKKSIQVKIL
ncbi:MAG: SurA N-terminal domain-containing protein [Candidatus Ratteibacteria bacterium]